MRRGSVIVDLAASELGGNVAGVVADKETQTPNGVTLIGAGEIARDMAPAASDAYARNVAAVIAAIIGPEGGLVIDPSDEVIGALLGGAAQKKAEANA
jgi:NAD(P) transhydrogenase subunit alpha